MASINFNPFNENWFRNQPKFPFQPLNLLSSTFKPHSKTPNFAFISNPFTKKPKPDDKPGKYSEMLEQFYWECENMPDYRHSPAVERILQEDPIAEKKENPTKEEIEENEKWWEDFRSNPITKFLAHVEKIADEFNEMELKKNSKPCHNGDVELWQKLPKIIGLDGRPMPRKSLTKAESDDKFWDFARQFFFGLWGYRQRPYPPGRPIDVAQAIGYHHLEDRYYDFIMKTSGWFYKDRLGRTRGPMELVQLKTACGVGIIDKDTFIWGEDMDEWAPISMIYGMERALFTKDVKRMAKWITGYYNMRAGGTPWGPVKRSVKKTFKQLQEEAYESKRRDLAVLEANGGVWPGVRTPGHALFLWAGGSELTTLLEEDHMPNKFISKDLRRQLQRVLPGLRPWMVLSVEQALDRITYHGEWYREPLGEFTTGLPFVYEHTMEIINYYEVHRQIMLTVSRGFRRRLPMLHKLLDVERADMAERHAKKEAKIIAEKRSRGEFPYL